MSWLQRFLRFAEQRYILSFPFDIIENEEDDCCNQDASQNIWNDFFKAKRCAVRNFNVNRSFGCVNFHRVYLKSQSPGCCRIQHFPIFHLEIERRNLMHSTVERGNAVSYTHLRAHETRHDLVCRLLLEKKKTKKK